MIEFKLIGTAAATPLPARALTSAVLTCSGRSILFDCGDGTQSAARRAHVSLMSIDVICLTHFHGDHIFGIPGLLQSLALHGRTRPVLLIAPEEDGGLLPALITLSSPLPFELRVAYLPEEGLHLHDMIPDFPAGAMLSPVATQHRVPSQGYRFTLSRPGRFLVEKAQSLRVPQRFWSRLQHGESIEVDGRIVAPADVLGEPRRGLSVVFTGDTRPCDAVREAARDADLLVMDATYSEGAQEELAIRYGHSTFAATARLAAEARVRRLWLVHYSAMIDDPATYLPHAQAHFPSAVCGMDGMSATLMFDP